MPKGVFERTIEYRMLMRRVMTPIMRSDVMRKKISQASLGRKHLSRGRKIFLCLDCGKKVRYGNVKCNSCVRKGIPWTDARRKAQLFVAKKISLANKPVIKNGKEYSPLWNFIRKEIYKRDDWVCQECRIKCHNEIKIQCHHIDYDTKNNSFLNLITLCHSCHAKTNFKREDWIKYFQGQHKPLTMLAPSALS